ncbi:prepilin peptidase CpaA [Paenibacillus phyllosphaerae]|uniref:Prepilin peptidase CpaA n=1 Tax=Paenibacillus phyllosphaerae TaxID=274593 RepID=A0A7W5B229_9BACL|nr:A24 family peptidase [Paenibacillus phyllosphaerae]MBB3112928.1 prepilin peptidase CpaA [Paenibacillus phyllosphaerae]
MSLAVTNLGAALLLMAAFISDVRSMRIPNWLTLPALAAGLLYHVVMGGLSGATAALTGAGAGFLPLMLLYLLKGIGAGDVKLFAALGAWVGPLLVLQTLMYAILYAGAVGVILVLALRPFGRRVLNGIAILVSSGMPDRARQLMHLSTAKTMKFPFMLAALPGALTAWYLA